MRGKWNFYSSIFKVKFKINLFYVVMISKAFKSKYMETKLLQIRMGRNIDRGRGMRKKIIKIHYLQVQILYDECNQYVYQKCTDKIKWQKSKHISKYLGYGFQSLLC